MAVDAGSKYKSVSIDTGAHTPLHEGEPVFTIRAQDRMAVPTLECYRELCEAAPSPPEHISAIQSAIDDVRRWQEANPELVNNPD